jgi:fructose-bisphosphate aldolase class II
MARVARSLISEGEYQCIGLTSITNCMIRFEMVRARANGRINLAIHGTNGFAPGLIKRCVAAGVTKINVNRLVLDDYYDHLRENVGRMSHTQLIEQGIQKVTDLTIKWMEICGSAGKA